MIGNKPSSKSTLKSDLKRIDGYTSSESEYEDLPELTEEMLKHGEVRKAGRPIAKNPRKQVTIRLPETVLARWKASGPGWQTRMAELLSKRVP